ncbi:MAG: WD40 repeat domain-containing protein, partial [Mesorhizobium sp.]
MNRSTDRLLSLPLLAAAIACVMHAWPFLATGAGSLAHPLADSASMRLTGFLVAALALVVGALLFLAGLLPGRPAHQAGAPLFGRAAEVQELGRPHLRRFFQVLPAVTVLALLADQPWRGGEAANEPKGGQDVVSAPPALATPPAELALAPAPPEQAVKTLPAAEPAPASPAVPASP